MSEFYVYELIVDGIARYIGMGKGHRVQTHFGIAKRLNRMIDRGMDVSGQRVHLLLAKSIRDGLPISHRFVATGLSNEAARALEIKLISKSRENLWNVHSGGGGASAERMVELWSDPEWRLRQTASLKAAWQDPDYRERMLELRSDPDTRRQISEAVAKRFSDPAERSKQSDRTKETFASRPELALQHSETIKARWSENREEYASKVTAHWSDPEQRDRQSDAAKRQWSDPIGREKLMQAARSKWTPELRAWRSQKTREQWAAKRMALAQKPPQDAVD